jgi:hypothetical protein
MQQPHSNTQGPLVPLVIPGDMLIHIDTHPFGLNVWYECHETPTLLAWVTEALHVSLLAPEEVTGFVAGRML